VGAAVRGQWERNDLEYRWELAGYHVDVPRQVTDRIVAAWVTDELIAGVADPVMAAASLFNKIGSVPPPLAGYLPPHDPNVVVYDLGEP
jgi:hypothetical protein